MVAPVVVVGAGLTGLNCAKVLSTAGKEVVLLEAGEQVGGRVVSDVVDGFVLDRGFQVLQTAYPEAKKALDYSQLQLVELEPGAVVWKDGAWQRMSDPLRRPSQALATMFNDIGGVPDRWRLLKMKQEILGEAAGPFEDLSQTPAGSEDCSLASYFERLDFSDDFIDCFLRPWTSGMFLEGELRTSAAYFKFVFRMLSQDKVTLPALGMQAIPDQLALKVPDIRLGTGVEAVEQGGVRLEGGARIEASAVVLATDVAASRRIQGVESSHEEAPTNATCCIYFAAPRPPTAEKALMLNGNDPGPINHVFVTTNSVPTYSQNGESLISVNLVADSAVSVQMEEVLQQLERWFGGQVREWRHLKTYEIPNALPAQTAGFFQRQVLPTVPNGVFVCGDYLSTASIQGALGSGRLAAEEVLKWLEGQSKGDSEDACIHK